MPKSQMTSEEKLDLILKYTKRAHHWNVFKGVISFLFFLIFVVLPLVGGFYFFNYLKDNVDWSKWKDVQGQFESFKNFDFKNLGAMLEQLPKGIPPRK